jgi:hypothetical protein
MLMGHPRPSSHFWSREFFDSFRDAVFHRPSLLAVTVFSISTSTRSSLGFLTFDANQLVVMVFPIAGTIIALALPAAQLSMDMINHAESVIAKIFADSADPVKKAAYIRDAALQYQTHLEPAWRAVVYALLSFLLSVVGSLGAFSQIDTSVLKPADVIATASLGFLVVASIWFYPTVRFAFNLELVKTMIKIAGALESPGPEPGKPGAVQTQAATQMTQAGDSAGRTVAESAAPPGIERTDTTKESAPGLPSASPKAKAQP